MEPTCRSLNPGSWVDTLATTCIDGIDGNHAADSTLNGNTQWTPQDSTFKLTEARAFGDMQWTPCGGFVPRPIGPKKNWKGDNYLGKDPDSTKARHKAVDLNVHEQLAATIRSILPEKR
jgi:hypothetical protein